MRNLIGGTVAAVLIVVLAPAPAHADVGLPVLREEAITVYDTVDEKSVWVPCPAGTLVVGVGGRTHNAGGRAVLTGVEPSLFLTGVTAYARALPDLDTPWALSVTAICGSQGEWEPVRRAAWVYDNTESATAFCPEGKALYSAGFKIPDAYAWQYLKSVIPHWSQQWVTVQAIGGFWPLESLAAFAVCGKRDGPAQPGITSVTVPMGSPTTSAAAPRHCAASWTSGAGVQASTQAAFVDGIGPDEAVLSAKARMARLYLTSGKANTLADEEMTVHGLSIGSWYDPEC